MQKQEMNQTKKKVTIGQAKTKQKKQAKTNKQEKAITLIALVVTIVVLLILAGVSIVVLFGDNGMIKTAGESTLQTKLAEIEERANIAYADLNSNKYVQGNPNKKITMQDIKTELEKIDAEKYQIRTENPEGATIKGIILNPTSIKLGKGDTATIEATYEIEESTNTHYYVKVEEKYYEISIVNNHINLDKANGKTEEEIDDSGTAQTKTITATSSDETVVTTTTTQTDDGATIQITAKEKLGTATITVSCESFEDKTCNITVAILPQTGVAPNPSTPITTGFGKIDILWLDENNNIIAEPKAPILQSKANPAEGEKVKMTPVKWNGTGVTATLVYEGVDETNPEVDKGDGTKEKEWYDYDKNRWANAKTENGSYFVWIPRYAYRITYYKSETDHTITGYYDGDGMWSAKNGAIKYALEDGIETVETEDGKYIVHPAFGTSKKKAKETDTEYITRKTHNINNGGWGDTQVGFWFAKFEMSGEDGASLKSTPGVQSVREKTIGEFYTMGRTATYGQTGTVDSFDGKSSFMNSHMVKNSEWGAVAYLTHSKYGLNGTKITINGSSYYTGGGTSAISYISNQNQSTTGNPYGVYDMSGGSSEYTGAFGNKDSNSNFGNTSKWTENTKLTTSSNSTKYATLYNVTNNSTETDIYTVCKTGDATKEVFASVSKGWFNNYAYFSCSSGPFFGRGGYRGNTNEAGVFCSSNSTGGASNSNSFHAALCP